ncbi:GFA family protein [Mesorhizobium sp. YIM 152430]|uniref:GFA family protein n=1 Tax=Mesorhizobium sp. YIM 152430 TaxID=3031761 RepID=UPI0023DB6C3B|nr:GFA family protein [Mesorhizobium sp. YIM 152430]MDF1598487.1 GFA family protein [Mesorhizobium sp. YIM 152430]
MDQDAYETVEGGCHCGGVRFRAHLVDGLNTARRCTCSLCAMRGAIAVSARVEDFQVEKGTELLTLYQFNTMVAEHWFCSVCGIYTHHRRRSRPTEFGINVACIDGLSPFDFAEVVVNDGQTHPNDRPPGTDGITGILRFDPR